MAPKKNLFTKLAHGLSRKEKNKCNLAFDNQKGSVGVNMDIITSKEGNHNVMSAEEFIGRIFLYGNLR
jgi:hypothetical protein